MKLASVELVNEIMGTEPVLLLMTSCPSLTNVIVLHSRH